MPYIKVSDLQAGLVNVNPTNRVPLQWAQAMWNGPTSGLLPFDLLCPERASKNIGDFCVLMPGQEQILITKEVIIYGRVAAEFDQFYLLWAMTLNVVRQLMGTIQNSPNPKVLANTAKHFAFTRCRELNLFGMVDAQIAVVESELLACDPLKILIRLGPIAGSHRPASVEWYVRNK